MKPIGYLPKIVVKKPKGITSKTAKFICSMCACISEIPNHFDFLSPLNDMNLYNSEKEAITSVKSAKPIYDLFYYEMFENEYIKNKWVKIKEIKLDIKKKSKDYKHIGFDIVSFSLGASFECSPLSCNNLAKEYNVNEYCLINTRKEAILSAEDIMINGKGEPEPYRIISIYRKMKFKTLSTVFSQ